MTATLATRPAEQTGDAWVSIPATWETYLRLLDDRGERSRPRYIFLDGRLTIVSPGIEHEWLKHRLTTLLHEILIGLRVRYIPSGAVTLKEEHPDTKGVEGDVSFYFTNLARLKGRKKIVMGVDPPPDLEIEVVVSHPVADALAVHAAFGVREVWVCGNGSLSFFVLQPDGRYEPAPTSLNLPMVRSDELSGWVYRDATEDDLSLLLEFRKWVENELAMRAAKPPTLSDYPDSFLNQGNGL
jgi:Uma2 family endonuclease